MRGTRAYLAGFGTAGCLLAATAVLFALASAVVSFDGKPEVSGQARVAKVYVPGLGGASEAAVTASVTPARRVLAAFAGRRPAAHAPATGTATQVSVEPSITSPSGQVPTGTTTAPANPPSVTTPSTDNDPPARTTPTATTTVGTQLGSDVTSVGSDLTGGVKTTTGNLGNGVTKVTSGLSSVISKISPNLSSAVNNVSSGVTTVINSATTGVSDTVKNVTGALARLLGGK